jgi:trehalose synthase
VSGLLEAYARVAGEQAVDQLRQLARSLRGRRIVHVNSTRTGGGVAEILEKLIPLTRELGIEASWEVIGGNEAFYQCTKAFHNGLQGARVEIPEALLANYEEVNRENARRLGPTLQEADYVFIHDPQPAPLLSLVPNRKGIWLWRCHIDVSSPHLPVWRYLKQHVAGYEASIFSLDSFARRLPHPRYIIPPSIDPLAPKNEDLPDTAVEGVREEFGLDPARPLLLQVSRFDRFKDPVGVVRAYRLARKFHPGLQLVLAGGTAADDPEGDEVLGEVRAAAAGDPDVHILLLPPDAHRTINALQRAADIVLQKSVREGFGLTVTEGMWKGKPVIGGRTGGIRLQLVDYRTGFLVSSPEGAALRIRQLLRDSRLREGIGRRAREFVREQFLLTRLLREHLTALQALDRGMDRVDLTGNGSAPPGVGRGTAMAG